MMKLLVVAITISLFTDLNAQEISIKTYRLEDVLNANSDTIYSISLSKSKLTELPEELWRFKNLKVLYLEKNRLASLPDTLDFFK